MYDRKQIKSEAKECVAENFGTLLGTAVVAGLINIAASYIPCAALILNGVITVGLAIVALNVVRRLPVQFGDMFKGFNNFGTTCLTGILMSIYIMLWSMLFVVPGIIKSISYAMTPYILADNPEMKPNEAITASRQMMNGHKADYFVLQLSFIGWHLLACITFGLAYIYAVPYMTAANAKFYESIKPQQNANVF